MAALRNKEGAYYFSRMERAMEKKHSFRLALFALVLVLLGSAVSAVGENRDNEFSDPDAIFEMSREWREAPLTYPEADKDVDLIITLNQQFMQFATYINEFAKANNIKVRINEGTCGISAGALDKKEADIAGFCCPPGKTDRLPGIRFHTIGIHPVSIIVHKSNPVEALTLEQVRDIFRGNAVYWSDVGGPNVPIMPVARLHCKKRPGHWRLILDNEDMFSASTRTVGAVDDVFNFVAANESSIGYEVLWMTDKYNNIKALRLDGMDPENLDFLLQNKYPVYRALNLTTWTDANEKPLANALVQHIHKKMDEEGRRIGMIPASELRRAGWKFKEQELIGAPD